MSITYQQAKRIRKTGLMGVFADQLMYEKSVGTAIKKTVSLKTRAAVKGVTQYLDPLNIAKMLTFGSALGPALLGHFMKRDVRDIQYFTGRLKPIHERNKTASRISRVPGGEGDGASNPILRKMYKLMANTHEENVKRRQLAKNREEENQLEDDRRHKELLETLSSLTGKRTASAIKKPAKEGTGLLGMLGDLIDTLKNWIKDFIANFDFTKILHNIFGGLKAFGTLLRFLAAPIFGFLMGPLFAVGTVLALAELLKFGVSKVDNRNVKTPEEAAAILQNAKTQKQLDIEGGTKYLQDIIINGPKRAAEILERGDAKEISDAGGIPFLEKVKKQTNVVVPETNLSEIKSVPARPDTTGGRNLNRAKDWDRKYGNDFDIPGKPKIVDETTNNAEMAKLQRQSNSLMSTPIGNDSVGKDFIQRNDEMLTGRVAVGVLQKTPKPTQVNNTNVNQQVDKTTPIKRPIPSVRNQEEEYVNRTLSNTRVAN